MQRKIVNSDCKVIPKISAWCDVSQEGLYECINHRVLAKVALQGNRAVLYTVATPSTVHY